MMQYCEKLVSSTVLLATKVMTLVGLICVMFYQNWKWPICINNDTYCCSEIFRKRVGKITTQAQEVAGELIRFFRYNKKS